MIRRSNSIVTISYFFCIIIILVFSFSCSLALVYDVDDDDEQSFRQQTHSNKGQIESLAVFAFSRADLIKIHLESIDYEVKQVFVVLNTFSYDVTFKMRKVLKRFVCLRYKTNTFAEKEAFQRRRCLNPYIRELIILESNGDNVGFAGSFNIVAKEMLKNNIPYTIISNDDTKFRRGSLQRIAKIFLGKPHVCLYLFSHFSSFGITQSALKRIGVMDEHFWPAYSEDVDYYLRSVLGRCEIFHSSDNFKGLFVDHGERSSQDDASKESATLKSSKEYRTLIENTRNKNLGRDAYLCKKWGGNCINKRDFLNTNKAFKAIFRSKRENHEILNFHQDIFSFLGENLFNHPFNNSMHEISWWDNDMKNVVVNSIVSPRLVNRKYAPADFVWKMQDWSLLGK